MRLEWRFWQSWSEPDEHGAKRAYGELLIFDDRTTAIRAWKTALDMRWVMTPKTDPDVSELVEWEVSQTGARPVKVIGGAPTGAYKGPPEDVKERLREMFRQVGSGVPG